MFDIHKIRPVHGWREFVGEVGIIVLGVLIALSAEAVAERWHWHELVAQSREAMKEDLFQDAMNAVERLAIAPCLRGRLLDLSSRLQADDRHWVGSPMYRHLLHDGDELDYVVQPAYAPPSRPYRTDAWKNALSSGTFNHFPNNDANALSALFSSIGELDKLQTQEAVAATRLSPLSNDRQLTDRDRSDALANVAEVDRAMTAINLISTQVLQELRTARLGFDDTRTQRDERSRFLSQMRYRGRCVSAKLVDFN